jgi:GTPase SAR1 family protein
MYYRGAAAAIVVYDITSMVTKYQLYKLCLWLAELYSYLKHEIEAKDLHFLSQDSFVRAKKWVREVQRQGNRTVKN